MLRGRHVIMACRDEDRCLAAKKELDSRWAAAAGPHGSCECATLDLAKPESIRSFAEQFSSRRQRLSLLVNNAGDLLHPPREPGPAFPSQAMFSETHSNCEGHKTLSWRFKDLLSKALNSE